MRELVVRGSVGVAGWSEVEMVSGAVLFFVAPRPLLRTGNTPEWKRSRLGRVGCISRDWESGLIQDIVRETCQRRIRCCWQFQGLHFYNEASSRRLSSIASDSDEKTNSTLCPCPWYYTAERITHDHPHPAQIVHAIPLVSA